jgi:hypothetical protein
VVGVVVAQADRVDVIDAGVLLQRADGPAAQVE